MSLSFGLDANKKAQASPPTPKRRPVATNVLGDDSDDDDTPASTTANIFGEDEQVTELDTSNPPSRPTTAPKKKLANKSSSASSAAPPTRKPQAHTTTTNTSYADLSAQRESAAHAAKATQLDATIYDYDSFHSAATSASAARKAAAKQASAAQGPKYMHALLTAAAQRKQDQQVAREKFLQNERLNEGQEFADKESFVTDAYKAQQVENQRLREQEEKKAAEEEEKKRRSGGGMQGFYRNVMADSERRHKEALEAAAVMEQTRKLGDMDKNIDDDDDDPETKEEKTRIAELAAKGVNVTLNDEGQVADKRQLLAAGLNIVASPSSAKTSSAAVNILHNNKDNEAQNWARRRDNGLRERQTRMMEQQLEESRKRALEQDKEEQERLEKASKSNKTETDISSARERFLARKRQKEAAAAAAAAQKGS
jgi:coiled-coil domain-containing protein 55